MKRFLLIAMLIPALASQARAGERPVESLARSMTSLYVTSLMCQDTLSPSPSYYARMISDYLQMGYMQNYYWALPPVTQRVTDREKCLENLQKHLIRYTIASQQFKDTYPEQYMPPAFAKLTRTTFTPLPIPAVPLEAPRPSRLDTIEQKFK